MKKKGVSGDSKHESEYKKGLQPLLWLTPDFHLKTEELLPLLDILANKVKAVRRLRELLTIKLPHGTFPVKVVTTQIWGIMTGAREWEGIKPPKPVASLTEILIPTIMLSPVKMSTYLYNILRYQT